ncbi:MAG: ExbD/TolR family protein [Pseudobdellovibrionaceae bacterium]
MKRAKPYKVNHNSEFELDLAPLLAVMVKLVPVLLVSSAFVQMMVIESELPQVVQEAIHQQDQEQKPTSITINISKDQGIQIEVQDPGQNKKFAELVQLNAGQFDFAALHQKLIEIKKQYPQIFKVELNPEDSVPYSDLVKVMDEARKARDPKIQFPILDAKTGKSTSTDYMFPEVVFANAMNG